MTARRRTRVVVTAAALVAGVLAAPAVNQAANATPFNYEHLNKIQKRLVSGALAYNVAPRNASVPNGGDDEGDGPDGLPDTPPAGYGSASGAAVGASVYQPSAANGCEKRYGSNVKVGQKCLNLSDPDLQGRGQANNETSIAQDPLHPRNLVASNNDYARGDGTCGASYSLDGGSTWLDSTVPDGFTRGVSGHARQYWQGGGDTSVAWDTRGNAYLSCQLFNRGAGTSVNADESSAFTVFRSTGNHGASWNFPGRYVALSFDPKAQGKAFEDKQLLTVDNHLSSPYRDRVYVSWTEFASDGTAYIYEAYSSDYGETFSKRVLVSRDTSMCGNTYGLPTPKGSCNENQYSDPFTGPDGSLYVVFANFNNTVSGSDNRNQMLLAKSTDGGASFGTPVKVSDYYDLPDCVTYQGDDPGRACVPEKGGSTRSVFRATNYPSGAVDPTDASRVTVSLGSYINKHSNESNGCVPTGFASSGNDTYAGVKKAGACNNDILVSSSTNGGASFVGSTTDPRQMPTVTNEPAQATTDQFWQWNAYTTSGRYVVSYYDRSYGRDEFNGYSDVSLSSSNNLSSFTATRVTTGSMPPPTQFYSAKGGVFYGDYTGLTAVTDAFPMWSDTRPNDLFLCPGTGTTGNPPQTCTAREPNGELANDQEVFTARVPVGS